MGRVFPPVFSFPWRLAPPAAGRAQLCVLCGLCVPL